MNSASPEGVSQKSLRNDAKSSAETVAMEAQYVVFVIVLLLRILLKKTGKMLYFVRVVVIVGYTLNV